MLTEQERAAHYNHLGLSDQAKAESERICRSPPARRVQGGGGNVCVRYPSRKMGMVIQAESHRNELAAIYEKEYDAKVLAYYDQPPAFKLTYASKKGRRVGVWHTADFFVIEKDGIGWEEWKPVEKLPSLQAQMPKRYTYSPETGWRCPPGEAYAAERGFFYRVRTSAEIEWVLQRNLIFLEDYLRDETGAIKEEEANIVRRRVAETLGITLAQLLMEPEVSSDRLYNAFATGQLYIDLKAAALAEPEKVRVFLTASHAKAFATMQNTAVLDDNQPQASQLHPTAVAQLKRASPADLATANHRYEVIAPKLAGEKQGKGSTPARTVRSWVAKWRQAEQAYGCGYVGLLPRRWAKGNRESKLPAETAALMNQFIEQEYETLKQKRKLAVYGALCLACDQANLPAPSYKSFANAIAKRPTRTQTQKRQGIKAAYAQKPPYWELTLTTPRHGDRPFEMAHIDHTQLDVELLCSQTNRSLGRPWATFLSDAYSRRILAVYVSFDRPTYRACMMVLRECVRRHERLPQCMMVDGGAEFHSVYFETLLARYECSKKTRPNGQARFGSVCERLFGTTNTRFIHNLRGNTQVTRNVRQMTKANEPQGQACWTLQRLTKRLCEWAYDVYDTLDHPALGNTPRATFEQGMAVSGQRPQRQIAYDETFMMLTLPTTRNGTCKVQPRMGVKMNYIYYWSDAFRDPEVEKQQVPVRFDPHDAGVGYAYVKGRWERCISEHYATLRGRTQREMQMATVELRRRAQTHQKRQPVTARRLAEFLASLEAEEVLLLQRLRDRASQPVERPSAPPETAQQPACRPETFELYEDY